jgi:hypothetical protein
LIDRLGFNAEIGKIFGVFVLLGLDRISESF